MGWDGADLGGTWQGRGLGKASPEGEVAYQGLVSLGSGTLVGVPFPDQWDI